jgi:hypothetical protein
LVLSVWSLKSFPYLDGHFFPSIRDIFSYYFIEYVFYDFCLNLLSFYSFQDLHISTKFIFHALSSLFRTFICNLLEFIQVFIYVLFNFTDHSYNHSFLDSLSAISSILLPLEFIIMELLTLEESCCLAFSYFWCFCSGICISEDKSLVGGFNRL